VAPWCSLQRRASSGKVEKSDEKDKNSGKLKQWFCQASIKKREEELLQISTSNKI
jgi:hypothetical protein